MAGPVPKKYYSNHMDNFDLKSFTTATVGRGSSLQLDYDIDKPGNLLRYRYLLQWLIFCKEYTFWMNMTRLSPKIGESLNQSYRLWELKEIADVGIVAMQIELVHLFSVLNPTGLLKFHTVYKSISSALLPSDGPVRNEVVAR